MPGLPAHDGIAGVGQLLADPVAEARQLIRLAAEQGLVMRALGGVAVFLQSADGQPRLVRSVKDIDLAVAKGSGKAASRVLAQAGYVSGGRHRTACNRVRLCRSWPQCRIYFG